MECCWGVDVWVVEMDWWREGRRVDVRGQIWSVGGWSKGWG